MGPSAVFLEQAMLSGCGGAGPCRSSGSATARAIVLGLPRSEALAVAIIVWSSGEGASRRSRRLRAYY